ncbi:glycerate kinase [Paenibacillus sp. HB172176]|uniref:glycerate kinase n=1 Tax=Paenibacillus sp. HB172176 TaxID=2493690 RepID=UPI001439F600|nr:glycerate kinase [Paenibacillus sp. HB172176]
MKIVIAPDSFKGSLTAPEAAAAIEAGIRKSGCEAEIKRIPLADGGEGTMICLVEATGGEIRAVQVANPLGERIAASYGVLGDGETCVIEMATAAGLYLIGEQDRNPLLTTTCGVGELIIAALDAGCRRFIVALGGSATNDGGAGMLQALGIRLKNAGGEEIGYGGGALEELRSIDASGLDPRIAECEFIIASDVDNPFVGENGASHVFGPQKGASSDMVERLDRNLTRFADLIERTTGNRIHEMTGAGAAGGLAGGIAAFLGGELKSGFEIVSEHVLLEESIAGAHLVFTGEGQTDFQTAHGKAPCGVARIAKRFGVPVIVLSGSLGEGIEELHKEGVAAVFSIMNRPMTLAQAMEGSAALLEQAAKQLTRLFVSGSNHAK